MGEVPTQVPKIFQKCAKGAPKKSKGLSRGCREGPKYPHKCPNGDSKSPEGATRGYKDPAGSPKQARGSPKGALARKSIRRQQIALGGGTDLEPRHEKNQEKIPRLFVRQPSRSVNSTRLLLTRSYRLRHGGLGTALSMLPHTIGWKPI